MNTITFPPADPAAELLRELNGATRPAAPWPHDADDIETLVSRAKASGHKRTILVAVRIGHDVDLLRQLLAQHEGMSAARAIVEGKRRELAEAEARFAALARREPPIARSAGEYRPAPSVSTAVMRAWLAGHGHGVAARGRLTAQQIAVYEAGQRGGE